MHLAFKYFTISVSWFSFRICFEFSQYEHYTLKRFFLFILILYIVFEAEHRKQAELHNNNFDLAINVFIVRFIPKYGLVIIRDIRGNSICLWSPFKAKNHNMKRL